MIIINKSGTGKMSDAIIKGFSLLLVFLFSVSLAQAKTFYVSPNGSDTTNGSQSNPWATVQYAVNNVSSGDTVHINPGTYIEQVTIDEDITLEGEDSANTVIKCPNNLNTSSGFVGIITVDTGNYVNIHNIKVNGDRNGGGLSTFHGISFIESGGHVNKCAIVKMTNDPFNGAQHGVGISGIGNDGTSQNVKITNSNIRDYQKNAVSFFHNDFTVSVQNTTVIGKGPTAIIAQNGLEFERCSSVSVKNNTITNISYTGGKVQSIGIFCQGLSDAVIKNNDLDEIKQPIATRNASVMIENNDIDVSVAGLSGSNNVSDFQGIYLWTKTGTDSCLVKNNHIKLNGPVYSPSAGLQNTVGFNGPGNLTVVMDSNTFDGWNYGIYNLNDNGSITNIAQTTTTFKNNNTKVAGSGKATINGSLISDAISATQVGDTVNFPAGTINESLTISKNLFITTNENPNVDDLTINGSGINVTLKDPLQISNSLTLTDGIVKIPNLNDSITINDGASVSGVSSSSYINGKVSKVGDESFTFPVGDGGRLAEIGISAPSSSTDAFTAIYNNVIFSDTSTFANGSGLNNVSKIEHWELNRTNGNSAVDVTLHWEDGSASGSNITDLTDLRIAYWDGSAWNNLGQSSTSGNTSSGTITVNNVSNFGPFTFGSETSSENPLPVEFKTKQIEEIQLYNDGSGTIKGKVGIDRSGQYRITVRNINGQIIHSEVKAWESGNQPFQLNLNQASKGIYLMEIAGHEQQFQQKFSIR